MLGQVVLTRAIFRQPATVVCVYITRGLFRFSLLVLKICSNVNQTDSKTVCQIPEMSGKTVCRHLPSSHSSLHGHPSVRLNVMADRRLPIGRADGNVRIDVSCGRFRTVLICIEITHVQRPPGLFHLMSVLFEEAFSLDMVFLRHPPFF